MYSIVVFEEENCVEGVPSSWIITIKHQTFCLWPKKDKLKIRKYVKSSCKPKDNWQKYKCRVKQQVKTYEQMLKKVVEAEIQTSTAELSESAHSSEDSSDSDGTLSAPSPPTKRARLCKYH